MRWMRNGHRDRRCESGRMTLLDPEAAIVAQY
jgi:hypothetical protein